VGVLTRTLTTPGLLAAGTSALSCVTEANVTELEALAPNLTLAPGTNPVPVIVTVFPPAVEPASGVILVTVGGRVIGVPVVLSNLPADTEPERLARLARMRWKMELDYKQLKGELGLDHYEGRSWLGWHHHTALVTAAHGFLTLERLNPFRPRPD
jgi:hypothetical protein